MDKNIFLDIETTGLVSVQDRITCISIRSNSETKSFIDLDEKKMLMEFWENINEDDLLISFNGENFDIPFIIKRSIIHTVKIKKIKSLDLRKVVNSWNLYKNIYEKGSLDIWYFILTGNKKTENGLKVIEYWNEGNLEEVKRHCEDDVMINELLYNRCLEVGLLNAHNFSSTNEGKEAL